MNFFSSIPVVENFASALGESKFLAGVAKLLWTFVAERSSVDWLSFKEGDFPANDSTNCPIVIRDGNA